MTPESLRLQNPPPPEATVVAMLFSTRRLLAERSLTSARSDSIEKTGLTFTVRATKITTTLRSIEGYSHGGLNE
ncbi:MAG: hypothetical protein WCK57_11185 [Verrucomicrobiae bacterium]